MRASSSPVQIRRARSSEVAFFFRLVGADRTPACRSAVLLESQLGVAMEIAPPLPHGSEALSESAKNCHRNLNQGSDASDLRETSNHGYSQLATFSN